MFEITINKLNGGLGRNLNDGDHISGLLVQANVSGTRYTESQVLYSVEDASDMVNDLALLTAYNQVDQYFKQNPSGVLYISCSEDLDFAAELVALQAEANGTLRQVAVLSGTAFSTAQVSALQTVADSLATEHMPVSILFSSLSFGSYSLSTLPDLTQLECPNVSVIVAADAGSSFPALGTALGVLSKSKVSENLGYVEKFNVVKGAEFEKLKFATGETYKETTDAERRLVKNKGYVFLRKYIGKAGSYFSDSNTATSATSDFAFVENVRTLAKAERGIYAALLPKLGSNVTIEDGKLSLETVTNFELLVQNVLDNMKVAGEISGSTVFINPEQDILADNTLNINVSIVPKGVARKIVVNLGFAVK